jgi:hypothetical protein
MLFFGVTRRDVAPGLSGSSRAFGPSLARHRMSRGVSLESIAATTQVPKALWEAFEDDDLVGWPSGALARSLVADYAQLIGEDPQITVDEFCRLFPHGDRRRGRANRDLAAVINQPLVWTDDVPVRERQVERRAPAATAQKHRRLWRQINRAKTLVDLGAITLTASAVAVVSGVTLPRTLMGTATMYYAASAVIRWSIGGWAVARLRGTTLTTPLTVTATRET